MLKTMAGRRGKRAKPPGVCIRCGKPITDAVFERDAHGDSHAMNPHGEYLCVKTITNHSGSAVRFCECESAACDHEQSCPRVDGLRRYDVGGLQKQVLCPLCATTAQRYCQEERLPLTVIDSLDNQPHSGSVKG